ncbi:MAG: methyltransferase, TIGR04325 family [Leptolyngbya sp.]|nr:methyltransferase, TIGR04325 family [Leptolyngbya sp.]
MIANIQQTGSWVLLKSAQVDPAYAALTEQVLAELETLAATPFRSQITWLDTYIFIASPEVVTPYHIDHEATFLFQIHGERTANLFDPRDRSILSEIEIEQYYSGNLGAALHTPAKQEKALIYPLAPGRGVHHPSRAPHWFKNGQEYSVAMGIHFCLRACDQEAYIYQANYLLRQLGHRPTAPGQSWVKDVLKQRAVLALAKANPKTKGDMLRSGFFRLRKLIQTCQHQVSGMKTGIRNSSQSLLNIPGVRDLYSYAAFPRIANGFRGVFATFEAAEKAIPQSAKTGYDTALAYKSRRQTFNQLNPSDRPLLPHLNRALAESQRVFDLGGSIGQGYYTYQNHVQYPLHLQWQVCEVSSAVAAGTQFAQEKGATNLSFTTQSEAADGADVFITCGALQYIQPSLAEILAPLGEKPRHLFIARVPFYDGPEYFTLQSILASKRPYKLAAICPYKIQNRDQFIGDLEALGYELVESWKNDRTCVIPFHPQRFVDGYHSFYFRRGDA